MLSSWLGRASALAGDKVIVIDCDMRLPSLHATLGYKNDTTLVDYLTGKANLEDVIQKDPATGMHMIYARAVPQSALNLVGSERMRTLIEALREAYDLVIIDTPAAMAASDARVLATLSDITLYGVRWSDTPEEAVLQGMKQFTDIGVRIASVLLNVNIGQQKPYEYGDTGYHV